MVHAQAWPELQQRPQCSAAPLPITIRVIIAMQFHTDGIIFKATIISGPSHNYLGLVFSQEKTDASIEAIDININEPKRLDAENVRDAVILGAQEANRRLSTSYFIKRIEFVPSDTPPAKIYTELAIRIIEKMHASIVAYNESSPRGTIEE